MRASISKNTTGGSSSQPIKYIKQRVYEAIDKFGEIIQGELAEYYVEKREDQHSGTTDVEYHRYDSLTSSIARLLFLYDYMKYYKDNFDECYDEHGSIRSTLILDSNANVVEKYSFIYENLQLIEKKYNNINYSDIGEIVSTEYMINLRHPNCGHDFFTSIKNDYTRRYEYDSGGKLISKTKQSNDNMLCSKIFYFYDESQKLIEKKYYNFNGQLVFRKVFKYNEFNKVEKETTFRANGVPYTTIVFEYENDELSSKEYEGYDFHIRPFPDIVRYENSKIANIDNKIEYYYDSTDLICKIKIYDSNKVVDTQTFKYEFDDNYNWIKKYHCRNDMPFALTIREIEYY